MLEHLKTVDSVHLLDISGQLLGSEGEAYHELSNIEQTCPTIASWAIRVYRLAPTSFPGDVKAHDQQFNFQYLPGERSIRCHME